MGALNQAQRAPFDLMFGLTGGDNSPARFKRDALPTSVFEILVRLNEITFNSALIAEMRVIDFVKRLLALGKLDPHHYKYLLMHRIDGGDGLEQLCATTKLSTDAKLIHALRGLGQSHAREWLAKNRESLDVRSTVNIARDYLDDLRVPVRQNTPPSAV